MIKWNIDLVRQYIEKSGCKLLSNTYQNVYSLLTLKCGECGKEYSTKFYVILGQEIIRCPECAKNHRKYRGNYTYSEIKNYIENSSDCLLLTPENEYKNVSTNLKLKCSCNNEFSTTFTNFRTKNKNKCNVCKKYMLWDINMVRDFVNKNSTCELLSTEFINVDSKLKFRCECGMDFETTWDKFKGKRKQRQCPDCSTRSNLERKCKEFFDANGIKYKREKVFKDFINPKTNGYPRYDFYLKQYNLLIECQGVQHKAETNFYGMQTEEEVKRQFKELQYRDELKRKYAEEHNIELLYIWYYELDDIPNILTNKLILPIK